LTGRFKSWFGPYGEVLTQRDVRLLFGGLTISATGSWAYNTALLAFIYERTHSLGWVGAAGVARMVASLVLSPYSGVVVERSDRFRLMYGTNLLAAVWQVGLAIVALSHGPVVLAIVFSVLTAAVTTFEKPAVGATMPTLVSERNLVAANALQSTIDNLTLIVGPANRGSRTSYAFVLDEFPELGAAATKLPKLLALGREARVTTIAALQDLGQLEKIYGPINAKLIEARLGIRCIMRLEDGDTIKRVCEEWIRIREIDRPRESTVEELKGGLTKRTERIKEVSVDPSVLADELGGEENGDTLTISALIHGFATEAMVEVPMTIWPVRRPAFEPAEWLGEIN